MGKRGSESKELHDKAVWAVASKRFPFPNKDHPSWQTYVNEPSPSIGVVSGDRTLTPDIVVVDESKEDTEDGLVGKSSVEMLGEIETESSVTEEEVDQWASYSRLTNFFFLYVPEGKCEDAKRLARNLNTRGFREWKFDSNDDISITDC